MRAMALTPLTDEQRAMVDANRGLIKHALRTLRWPGDWEDAFQDGVFGLMRAAQLFDPERGVKFSTYAMFWVKRCVIDGSKSFKGHGFRYAMSRGLEFKDPLSLDRPITESGEVTLGDTLVAEHDVEAEAMPADGAHLKALLLSLTLEERQILGLPESVMAERLGVSRQRVAQRRRAIRGRLRRLLWKELAA